MDCKSSKFFPFFPQIAALNFCMALDSESDDIHINRLMY